MSYNDRKDIIKRIEEIRNSKVITYVVSTRPNIKTMIQKGDLRIIFDHLNSEDVKDKNIDLFLYSNGGESIVAWPLCNLIREHSKKFSVLIPSNAFSCATSIALGADEIVMNKMGSLGPIDPTVSNLFNPIVNNQIVGISVEDVAGYKELASKKFGIKDSKNLTEILKVLAKDIRPLALGNAYRNYVKARDDAKKLLKLHMSFKDYFKIKKIVSVLVEKLYYHGHHVNRVEAKNIGLNVVNSEQVDEELAELIWKLYRSYEDDLDLNLIYKDELPLSGTIKQIPIKYVESLIGSNVYSIEQEWVNMGFPDGSQLSVNNGQLCVVTGNQILPIIFKGEPVRLNNIIYDKIESGNWSS